MKKMILALALIASTAFADNPSVLVVDTRRGDDANECSPQSPCKTVQAALAKVTMDTKIILVNRMPYPCSGGICNVNQ
jgi:hypothetical protein